MKKKQIKKEQEKLRKERNQVYIDFSDKSDVKRTLLIAVGVILFISLVFVGKNILDGNWKLFTKENKEISDQGDNRLMCGTLFDVSKDEYKVLAYDFSNDDKDLFSYIVDANGLYSLDTNSAFNRSCVGDKLIISNDINNLKLTSPTLLILKDGEIISSYANKDKIIDYFTEK